MHEDDGYWVENIKSAKTWKRGFFLLVFVAILWFSRILLYLAALAQFLTVLVTRRPIVRLLPFGRSLSVYVQEICMFLTWNREEKPFPWSPWPEPGEGAEYPEDTDYDDRREYSDAPFDPEPKAKPDESEPEPLSETDYAGDETREEEEPEKNKGAGDSKKPRAAKKSSRKSATQDNSTDGQDESDAGSFAEPPRPDA